MVVAPQQWIVKGGFALDLRLRNRARGTQDLDLARSDSDQAALDDLLKATELDIGDFFNFTVLRDNTVSNNDDLSIRYRVRSEVAGRRFEQIALDIGFADPFPNEPDILTTSTTLSFVGMEPVSLPALPLDLHIAQKLHAYTRVYQNGRPSSRVKDLIDLVLISSMTSFKASLLNSSLRSTFSTRNTHALPNSVPLPPANWGTPYRKLALQVDLDPDLTVGHIQTAEFLDPVLSGTIELTSTWDPAKRTWS